MVSLLATTYFGPVQWYQKLNQSDRCLIERHDHFIKQTYRNRCLIATADGVLPLTVPVQGRSRAQGGELENADARDASPPNTDAGGRCTSMR